MLYDSFILNYKNTKYNSNKRKFFSQNRIFYFFLGFYQFCRIFVFCTECIIAIFIPSMKDFISYIKLIKEPTDTWKELTQKTTHQNVKTAYLLLLLIVPFSVAGKLIAIAELNWNILISNALATLVASFVGLHIASSVCKIYYDKVGSQSKSYSDCLQYVAYASVAIYATIWLVEITQMSIFWLCSLYTLKIVLESVQSKFIAIDEEKKLTFVWVITSILIASFFLMQYILGMMVKS